MVSYNEAIVEDKKYAGLNPCCNGRWSRTYLFNNIKIGENIVLILVVMEDGLVPTL